MILLLPPLAGMASLIMTLPTLFDLQTHGEKLTAITKLKQIVAGILIFLQNNSLDLLIQLNMDLYPMIFVGLLPFYFDHSIFHNKIHKVS